jgi:predicted outer membrane protein
MKTILLLRLAALVGVYAAGGSLASAQPAAMNESALFARARLLTQEELEISRRGVRQAGSEKVRAFAKRAAEQSETLDKKLVELGQVVGLEGPEPGTSPLVERLNVIEKLHGEAFDADYLKLVIDFHHEHIEIYERLLKHATTASLRDFARAALTDERAHLKAAQELAAPLIPEAKPAAK